MCHSFSGRRTAPCKIPENFVLSAAARHSKTRPLCRPKPWPRPWPPFSIGESACSLGQNASVLSGEGNPSHSLFCYIALRHLRTTPERPAAFRRLCLLSSRRGSQAKPDARSAGKTLREEKAVTRKECAKAHTGFAPQCKHCYHAGAGNDSLKRCFFRPFESL